MTQPTQLPQPVLMCQMLQPLSAFVLLCWSHSYLFMSLLQMPRTIVKHPEEHLTSISHLGGEQVSLPTCKITNLCECVCWGLHAQYQPVLVHVHVVTQGVGASTYHENIGVEV